MHWTNTSIVLATRKHGETSGVVSLLTQEHGLFKGLVRGISGKKQCGIYQLGNEIEATWRGRLSEHLGSFSAELLTPNAALLLQCPDRLAALHSICSLLDFTMAEREQAPEIFLAMQSLIEHFKNDDDWLQYYVHMEIKLLSHLGFGLDLSSCAATASKENLIYISPKSGCAVSANAGEPYKDNLFTMPNFLIEQDTAAINREEICNGLNICAYFLEKFIFKPHNAGLPASRIRFGEMIEDQMLITS